MGNIKIGSLIARGSKDAWPDIFLNNNNNQKMCIVSFVRLAPFLKSYDVVGTHTRN